MVLSCWVLGYDFLKVLFDSLWMLGESGWCSLNGWLVSICVLVFLIMNKLNGLKVVIVMFLVCIVLVSRLVISFLCEGWLGCG